MSGGRRGKYSYSSPLEVIKFLPKSHQQTSNGKNLVQGNKDLPLAGEGEVRFLKHWLHGGGWTSWPNLGSIRKAEGRGWVQRRAPPYSSSTPWAID